MKTAIRLVAGVTAIFLSMAGPEPARAVTVTIPWTVDVSIPAPAPPNEASWGMAFPSAIEDIQANILFSTEHTPSYQVHLPYQISIEYPDIVSPGEVVTLTTSATLLAPSFTTSSHVEFDTAFGVLAEGQSIQVAALGDTLGAFVPSGLLWGGLDWTGTDTTPEATTIFQTINPWGVDHFGNAWDPSMHSAAEGADFSNEGGGLAWNSGSDDGEIQKFEVLDRVGQVLGPASIVGAFYDVYLSGVNYIHEETTFQTGTVTGYYTYAGMGGNGYGLFPTNNILTPEIPFQLPSITIPDDLGLTDGDAFDIQMTGFGLDYRTLLLYSLLGANEFGSEFCLIGCTEVAAVTANFGSFFPGAEFEVMDSWDTHGRYFGELGDGAVLHFTIQAETARVPEPGIGALLAVGLGMLAALALRKRPSVV